MVKNLNYTLCDTYSIPEYEWYVEDCNEMDIEPEPENSQDYWDWVYRMQENEWDDFCANMKYSKEGAEPCIITGHLGLWYGQPEIEPTICDNLMEAINKCARSVDDVIIKMVNGVVEVQGLHHDGRNCFEIRKIVDDNPTEYTDYLY